jgi:tetratricopeptide (TPR) repeat protein
VIEEDREMKILKWVVHPLFILLIIIAIAIYINRGELFSKNGDVAVVANKTVDTTQPVDTDPVKETANDDAVVQSPAVVSEPSSQALATEEKEHVVAEAVDAQPAETQKAIADNTGPVEGQGGLVAEQTGLATASIEEAQEPAAVATGSSAAGQPDDNAVVAEAAVAEVSTPTETETSEITPAFEEKSEATGTAVVDNTESTIEEARRLQFEARRAAFQGDLDAAESSYHKLIEIQPHNINAYGQLGDIYLRKQDMEKAVEAYSNAAELLYKSRRRGMAWRVLNYIGRISPEKAQELRSRLLERQ